MVDDDDEPVELNLGLDTVWFILTKARAFDTKVDPVGTESGSNAIDDGEREALEDTPNDATEAELREAIVDLNDDETVDLIALTWVGRGDYGKEEWEEARSMARDRSLRNTADYLMGIPTLGDFLAEGLAVLGHASEPLDDV